MDFHRRQLSTTLTPESVSYMLAMFLFERTADVQIGPLILFAHVFWTECVGKVGSGGSGEEQQGKRGQEFESRRNVKLMRLAQCIILWSEKFGALC